MMLMKRVTRSVTVYSTLKWLLYLFLQDMSDEVPMIPTMGKPTGMPAILHSGRPETTPICCLTFSAKQTGSNASPKHEIGAAGVGREDEGTVPGSIVTSQSVRMQQSWRRKRIYGLISEYTGLNEKGGVGTEM